MNLSWIKLFFHFGLLVGTIILTPLSTNAQLSVIDPWVDAIVDFEVGENVRGVPENLIGAPGSGDSDVNGEFAMDGGFVILDMGFGEEIEDGRGNDFRIYEGGDNEDYQVWVSNQPDNGWIDLGIVNGNATFDLNSTGLEKVRYLRIEDRGYTNDGADLESVEAIYYPNDPWADEVVSFELNPEWVDLMDPNQMDPEAALGPIDDDEISLPFSTIIVRFINNTVIDAEGDDLFIAESGSGGESALISISTNGQTWTELGIADNNTTTAFDLASINYTQPVVFVRIEGLNAGGSSPGFDLDAVFALPNSIGAAPFPLEEPSNESDLIEWIEPGFEITDVTVFTGMRPMYPDGFKPLFSEDGEVFIAVSESLMPSSPFAKIVRQRAGSDFESLLQIKNPSPEKQILNMWSMGNTQIGLLIGPDRQTDDGSHFYSFVRITGPFNLTGVSNSWLH